MAPERYPRALAHFVDRIEERLGRVQAR